MMINVYDNIISEDMHKKVYQWGQTVPWYCHWIGLNASPHYSDRELIPSLNEYNPSVHGNYNARHYLGEGPHTSRRYEEVMKFSLYRHPIGWDDKSTETRNPLIYNLWCEINDHIFNGKATLSGVPENIAGLKGPQLFYLEKENFYKKHNVPETQKEWTCFLNARCHERPTGRQSKKGGQLHKDTDGTYEGEYYSVVYITNLNWVPEWGGEIVFYDERETGSKHWKHKWNIGWPEKIVGNTPNSVVVFNHDQTHHTLAPRAEAPEMSQKIAFRCKVT